MYSSPVYTNMDQVVVANNRSVIKNIVIEIYSNNLYRYLWLSLGCYTSMFSNNCYVSDTQLNLNLNLGLVLKD